MTSHALLAVAFVLAQAAPQAPAFDVASIKPSELPLGGRGPQMGMMNIPRMLRSGRLEFSTGKIAGRNVTVRRLILAAFRLPETQLEGGPDWLDTDQFDIEAKAQGPANDAQLCEMLQTLLAARFNLVTHRRSTDMAVDALVVRNSGLKLQPWREGQSSPQMFQKKGITGVYLAHGTMEHFAEELSHEPQLYRPVVDRTGLSGEYLIHLEWKDGGSKLTALKDAGLQLRSQKASVDVLIVDHVERPDEN